MGMISKTLPDAIIYYTHCNVLLQHDVKCQPLSKKSNFTNNLNRWMEPSIMYKQFIFVNIVVAYLVDIRLNLLKFFFEP